MGHWIPTYSLLKIDVLPILLNSTNLLPRLSFPFPYTWYFDTIYDINFTYQTVGYKRKCNILQQCITNIFAQQYVLCKNEKILLHLLIPFIICLNSLKFNYNQLGILKNISTSSRKTYSNTTSYLIHTCNLQYNQRKS